MNIDANKIFENLTKKVLFKLNKSLFLRKIKSKTALNQDEIVVAIGIIIKPMLLK